MIFLMTLSHFWEKNGLRKVYNELVLVRRKNSLLCTYFNSFLSTKHYDTLFMKFCLKASDMTAFDRCGY